jgi:hypothetical protein
MPEIDPATLCKPAGSQQCVDIHNDSPQDILAHVLVAEGCSTGAGGMANIAQVVRNRKNAFGSKNIVSIVTREDTSVNGPQRYTFVGLANGADRSSPCWQQASTLASELISGGALTPAANSKIASDVLYYCATDKTGRDAAAAAGSIAYEDPPVQGTYHIFRKTPCQ